ncbi:MAG: acyl-CoA dehydratase activase [Vulcanimicrobiota bacterium]
MKIFMGIDIGSLSTDGVIIDETAEIINSVILPTGASIKRVAKTCKEELLKNIDQSDIESTRVITTGYGRKIVDFADGIITEITAHALGARHIFDNANSVIDMGGQDTKAINLDEKGKVIDFVMNDKCAAGTGRFLEVMARILELDLEQMAELALKAEEKAQVTSTCTVFIESEIISLLSQDIPVAQIASGVFDSITSRVTGMAKGINCRPPFVLTGGVAKNKAIYSFLAEKLNGKVLIPDDTQIIGALGAAIYGRIKHI